MKSSRQLAFDALINVFKDKAYSNIAIDRFLSKSELEKREKSFVTALFYGVIERNITLLHIINGYSKKPASKLDIEVSVILQMGIYQLLYMKSVPDSAAVNESVALAAYARKASAKGFINAVLRGFIRDDKEIRLPSLEKNPTEHYSVKLSCPTHIFSMWTNQYGLETAVALCEEGLKVPPITVRVNTLKTTPQKLIGYLEKNNVKARLHDTLENCLVLSDTGEIDRIVQFKQGLFHVQDVASQQCIATLSPMPGQRVIDACSAPGSKSFTMAQLMKNEGEILALDLYEHKCKLINQGAKRLGISIIKARTADASAYDEELTEADCVLCDVPCSGLGIIRRKPEIKLKAMEEIERLPKTQYAILQNASRYVKKGGRLVYSTCTLNKAENEEVVNRFLNENSSFEPLQLSIKTSTIKDNNSFMTTLMPHKDGCDGFFYAFFQRRA